MQWSDLSSSNFGDVNVVAGASSLGCKFRDSDFSTRACRSFMEPRTNGALRRTQGGICTSAKDDAGPVDSLSALRLASSRGGVFSGSRDRREELTT